MSENIYRIWRSPYARFGGLNSLKPDDSTDETLSAADCYTDDVLRDIADHGFNAIWVHGVLANLVKSPEFPEFGRNSERHIAAMNRLIANAARFGIKVLIYCQPVRSVAAGNTEFWNNHPDCKGQMEKATEQILPENLDEEIDMISLCTSAPAVKSWVRSAGAFLAEKMPDLGGVILITASEYPGHCYSHRTKRNPGPWSPLIECPRCREREPHEIAAELINLMHEGIRSHSAAMDIIAWNWGWTMWLQSPCREMLDLLPKDVIIMCGCERGGSLDLAERTGHPVNEYSLIYGGPSPLCRETLQAAAEKGFRCMTKLQLGSTHELCTVVNLPMIGSIFDKALWHRKHPDVGFMGCWNCGNMFGANTEAFNFFREPSCPEDKTAALKAFAEQYFPGCNAEMVLFAWKNFCKATEYFPFAIPFLYRGPHTTALAYSEIFRPEELHGRPFGCSYLFTKERGDDLSPSFTMRPDEFSLDELIGCLGKMAVLWKQGTDFLAEGLRGCDEKYELGNAVICGCIWQSTENIYRMWRLRNRWKQSEKTRMAEFRHILRSELKTIETALPWVDKDPRQGWHGEAHCYFFNGESMRAKLAFLKQQQGLSEE